MVTKLFSTVYIFREGNRICLPTSKFSKVHVLNDTFNIIMNLNLEVMKLCRWMDIFFLAFSFFLELLLHPSPFQYLSKARNSNSFVSSQILESSKILLIVSYLVIHNLASAPMQRHSNRSDPTTRSQYRFQTPNLYF